VSLRYLGRRAVQALITIVFVLLLNFLLFRLAPGSPERVLLRNPSLTPQAVQEIRARWGLDKPLVPDQLVAYVESMAKGDLGYSFKYRGEPVVDVIASRFWPTIILLGSAELVAMVFGLALGAYAGWRRGGRVDRIGNGLGLVLYSMPYFVIGMPLVIIFATTLGWFPTGGMFSLGVAFASPIDQLLNFLWHLTLPLATVSLALIGGYSILMRSSIIETRGEDFVTTARAKGLPEDFILRKHAFPNALLPTVTLIAINLGYVVGGAFTAEIVFNWPGLGTLTVDALNARDYPVLQGIFLFISVAVIVANFAADILYGYLDPRVKTE